MGDHGNRMDPLSGTNAGVKEDNNPALFIILPKKLRRNWRLRAILEENSRQLVSHYDVYATMVAIARVCAYFDLELYQLYSHNSTHF